MADKNTDVKLVKEKEDDITNGKRILAIYDRLIQNEHLVKKDLAKEVGVSERTIERNIKCINEFLKEKSVLDMPEAEEDIQAQLNSEADESLWEDELEDDFEDALPLYKVESHKGAYAINNPVNKMLKDSEAYAIIKMLLECRGLNKTEIEHLYKRIIECCVAGNDQDEFKSIILREAAGYKGPQHDKLLIDKIWDLQKKMRDRQVLEINYTRNDGKAAKRKVMPVNIMFNEYYFYLLAYTKFAKKAPQVKTEELPIVYRIDRIMEYEPMNEQFKPVDLPVTRERKEADFRQHAQFMYMDKLKRVIFTCTQDAKEANLDRLPSATVLEENKNKGTVTISAVIYGKEGMDMWLRSQGEKIIDTPKYVNVPVGSF